VLQSGILGEPLSKSSNILFIDAIHNQFFHRFHGVFKFFECFLSPHTAFSHLWFDELDIVISEVYDNLVILPKEIVVLV
jgi:hypothetical protein